MNKKSLYWILVGFFVASVIFFGSGAYAQKRLMKPTPTMMYSSHLSVAIINFIKISRDFTENKISEEYYR